jgi:chromosome segregation ATPase
MLHMEKGNEIGQFEILEGRLNKILEGYTTLKEEREKLISQMKEREKDVEKLKEELYALKNERSEVRTRIERLIKRLEGIPLDQ